MLTVKLEISVYEVRNDLWAGAKQNVELLSDDEIDIILDILDDCSCDDWTLTTVNDFFWFDSDIWAEWIGYKNFEHFYEERTCHLDEEMETGTDADFDRYAVEVQNGDGYYDSNGHFHWYRNVD